MAGATTPEESIRRLASEIAPEHGDDLAAAVLALAERYRLPETDARASGRRRLDASDSLLIAYADQIRADGEHPLATLRAFLAEHAGFLSNVHLLPFYPYTSDDGFGVVDYLAVDERAGTWADVEALTQDVGVMFDAVINHISASSPWIRAFLDGDPEFADFAIAVDPSTDLSQVVRPRTSPLLTRFDGADGETWLWTTFSADQVDLNYANPRVLLAVLEVLCRYVRHGASLLRLDAVAFLWKEIGTACIHLPNTHRVIRLIRAMLDAMAPGVSLVTETNVPHAENVSYFGDGTDEAQMVYNFALPPLVLHTFRSGEPLAFVGWLSALSSPGPESTFLNFLASHDGIGLRGVEGILAPQDRDALAAQAERHGGFVSYRTGDDGEATPYELNISYFDALSDPRGDEPLARQIQRFLCATSLMMAVPGVPGIYLHSLLGSRSDRARAERLGSPRAINRATLDRDALERELSDPDGLRSIVLAGMRRLVTARAGCDAFDPAAACATSEPVPGVVRIVRTGRSGSVICLHNVRATPATAELPDAGRDLISGDDTSPRVVLPAYGHRWIRVADH